MAVSEIQRVNDEATKPHSSKVAEDAVQELYEKSWGKPYHLELRDERMVYRRLMDHLNDIETKKRHWRKHIEHAVALFIFCGLVAALVCSLTVDPTNKQRLLRLRIWQWVTMAIMVFGVFSVVPFFTLLLSWPFKLLFRTHKYWIYFLRRLKRSVDVTLWSCLVLLGWYVWFRPRLKHVYGDVSVIACQQITRLLIAVCIGAALWTLKDALYLKLKSDLHYHQLFDRISQTIVFLNGYEILEIERGARADFLAYDEQTIDDFAKYENEENKMKKTGLLMRYVMRRKWNIWFQSKKKSRKSRNIWMDVMKMKRENVPIWILVRLVREYLERVKVLTKTIPNVDQLINDDHQLLEKAKNMFKKITDSTKQDIDQFDEIEENHLTNAKYNLSREELDYLFTLRQHQLGEESKNNHHEGEVNKRPNQEEEIKKRHPQAEANSSSTQQENKITEQENQSETPHRAIEVDNFLQWAVRVHKNCWGLERTLASSKIAFVKLNRMLSAFLIVLVAIIWLLLSKIVNTGQLALLFAPFLAASFMFENSSKNMLNGIIFAFAMHPFDVGDRVIIEDIQMRVKELNILTSVFYKYDTGAEVIFPNSKLATTKIVNLDITPDQSDKLEFVIRSTTPTPSEDTSSIPPTPLENIKDLELKIQKLLDDDLYYASGTKVVKNGIQNPEKPLELHMTVHFKYLVSYLTAEKKAERRSEILSMIMKFRKEMEMVENIKEYPLDYKPYDLEFTTHKKVKLSGIERLKREILRRLDKEYKCCKIVLTNLEDKKVKMALYVSKSQGSISEEELKSDDVTDEFKKGKFFAENFLQEYGYTDLKVLRGDIILFQGKWKTFGSTIMTGIQNLRLEATDNAAATLLAVSKDDKQENEKAEPFICSFNSGETNP